MDRKANFRSYLFCKSVVFLSYSLFFSKILHICTKRKTLKPLQFQGFFLVETTELESVTSRV